MYPMNWEVMVIHKVHFPIFSPKTQFLAEKQFMLQMCETMKWICFSLMADICEFFSAKLSYVLVIQAVWKALTNI